MNTCCVLNPGTGNSDSGRFSPWWNWSVGGRKFLQRMVLATCVNSWSKLFYYLAVRLGFSCWWNGVYCFHVILPWAVYFLSFLYLYQTLCWYCCLMNNHIIEMEVFPPPNNASWMDVDGYGPRAKTTDSNPCGCRSQPELLCKCSKAAFFFLLKSQFANKRLWLQGQIIWDAKSEFGALSVFFLSWNALAKKSVVQTRHSPYGFVFCCLV